MPTYIVEGNNNIAKAFAINKRIKVLEAQLAKLRDGYGKVKAAVEYDIEIVELAQKLLETEIVKYIPEDLADMDLAYNWLIENGYIEDRYTVYKGTQIIKAIHYQLYNKDTKSNLHDITTHWIGTDNY